MTELLRLATAGSVDDGKSTLIGRLLFDSKAIFTDQLDAVERTSRRAGRRLHQPGPADRRPARRAGAGHHHRRRLPLFRHPPPQVHHRRHPRARAVHPQHGHRGIDRRPGPHPHRCPQRRAGAVPPPRLHRQPARHPALRGVRQQDGPGRLVAGRASRRSGTSSATSPPSSRCHDLTFVPVSALHGDNVVQPQRQHALVRGHARCCTTSRTSTSPPTAT